MVERERERRVTVVEFSVEVDAPPEAVWAVASDGTTSRTGTST